MSKKKKPPSFNLLTLSRAVIGPAFLVGGAGVISTSYLFGVGFIYLGFAICLLEIVKEPMLLASKRWQIQVALIGVLLFFFDVFTITTVLPSAPLVAHSYAIKTGEYPPETKIAGITWNPHFTDLRVSITNATDSDYSDLDLQIQPDRWNYQAAILEENTGCLLSRMGGPNSDLMVVKSAHGGQTTITTHLEGDKFYASDNQGDTFETFVSPNGYRLRCEKFPSHFTVQVVFALVTPDKDLLNIVLRHNLKQNTLGMAAAEIASTDIFNLLTEKPSTSSVFVRETYRRGVKPFSTSCVIAVENGN